MKKGFTLVEMLAVIIIIGVLSLVMIPSIESIIEESEKDTYEAQVEFILSGLKNYVADNIFKFSLEENQSKTITLGELKTSGYVDVDIRNPETDECFSNNTNLIVTKENNKFKYSIDSIDKIKFYESDTCDVDLE